LQDFCELWVLLFAKYALFFPKFSKIGGLVTGCATSATTMVMFHYGKFSQDFSGTFYAEVRTLAWFIAKRALE